ncbi:hypothetical protein Pint_03931 [Pistacia integerrima]|uniref:Uncharacterized protein n=1 Tax=Pistacia integerrima TaxID=434235 RepID=A0ACC0Z1P1_9ROSI|nr:hypothetical protein Pint_03931 [Pistacia integerrima]
MVGIRIRAVLVEMVYNKGLTLSCQAKQERTSGEIINFMTVDAERVVDFSWSMHDPWIAPVQVGLALFILYRNLGLASIATFLAIIIAMVPNFPLGRLQNRFQVKLMESKDTRMKATSKILRNMRILKLQGWERKFLLKIVELRMSEAGWLKKYLYTSAMTSFVFWGAPTSVFVATFGACMLLGIPLESSKILSALATLRILQQPIQNLPDTISTIIQTKVSLDRIASFLSLEDLKADVMEKQPIGSSDKAIDIADANFSWDVSSPNQTLRDINLKVFHGMRVAVCGTVSSGKSSLLSCISGEVLKISGTLKLCGTKAYVAQSPWLQSPRLKTTSCLVRRWTEKVIGERGINFSGGQKQRIQIARALYHDADIYLFDDPFSAVDAHTGSHLFKASTDQSAVDLKIPSPVGSLVFLIIRLLGIIIVMSQVAWQVFLVFIPVIASSIWYQHTSLSPDGKLLIIVGDNPEGMLVDSNTGKPTVYEALAAYLISWAWAFGETRPTMSDVTHNEKTNFSRRIFMKIIYV